MDRHTKSCLHNTQEGVAIQNPGEEIFNYYMRVPKDVTSMSTDIKIEFDCPCSANYGFTAPPTSHKSKSGKAQAQGSTAATTASSTTSDADKCYVSVPAFNNLDADLSTCASIGLSVTATKNMCPGQATNESSTDATDFTVVNATLIENSSYNTSNFQEGDYLDISSYTNLKCTGPSLDVSFY